LDTITDLKQTTMAENYRNRDPRNSNRNDDHQNRPDSHRKEDNDQGFSDLDGDGFIGNTGGFYGGTSYLGANYDDWNNNMNNSRSRMRRDDYSNEFDQRQQRLSQDNKESYRQQGQQGNRGQHQQNQSQQWQNRQQTGSGMSDQFRNRFQQNNQYGQGQQSNWEDQRINRSRQQQYNQQQHSNHENSNYRQRDDHSGSSWWDKAKDEVSSWFGDDDNDRNRRQRNVSGPHRGKGPKGYTRSAERIRDDINDRLADDPFVDASDIEVEINGNEVILKGNVQSREDKRRAEDIVEAISGVSHVENRLRINRNDQNSGSGLFQNI
jgi:osmotically-inducible protein OsmY